MARVSGSIERMSYHFDKKIKVDHSAVYKSKVLTRSNYIS
jgi:hypothetical protein